MGVRPLTPLLVAFDGVVVDSLGFWEAALADVVGPAAPGGDVAPFFDAELPEALAAAGLDAARPVPLLPPLLAELAAGRRLLVVAVVARAAVAARLAGLGLGGAAEAVGPDEAPAVAGERAALLAAALAGAAAEAGGSPAGDRQQPWFVVDTVADARLAGAVGARPLGVAWGRHGPERLRAAGVEEVVDTPVALARAVDPAAAVDLLGLG